MGLMGVSIVDYNAFQRIMIIIMIIMCNIYIYIYMYGLSWIVTNHYEGEIDQYH